MSSFEHTTLPSQSINMLSAPYGVESPDFMMPEAAAAPQPEDWGPWTPEQTASAGRLMHDSRLTQLVQDTAAALGHYDRDILHADVVMALAHQDVDLDSPDGLSRAAAAASRLCTEAAHSTQGVYWHTEIPMSGSYEPIDYPDPSATIENQTLLRTLTRRLSEDQMRVLFLLKACGNTYAATAEEMGTTPAGIKRLAASGLARARYWAEEEGLFPEYAYISRG